MSQNIMQQAATMRYKNDVSFLSVLSDGLFHMKVPAGTPGAVKRTYEDRKTKQMVTVDELLFDNVEGDIKSFTMKDGNYGLQVYLGVGDVVVCVGANSNFGEDLLKKVHNIDFKKPITVRPYSFPSDNNPEKMIKGLTLYQDGEKLQNYFYDPEAKVSKNGYPVPEQKYNKKEEEVLSSRDDWKLFYLGARKFLVEQAEQFVFEPEMVAEAPKVEYPKGPEEDVAF